MIRFMLGKPILSCERVEQCYPYDGFLASVKQLDISSPAWNFSRRISYADLKNQIFSRLSSEYGFKSMAYELSSDYSRIGHTHAGYNTFAMNGFMYENASDDDSVLLAKIQIDGQVREIRMRRPVFKELPEPVPGQLKFMATPGFDEIDVDSDDFDGWVYADGQTYSNDFEYASYFESAGEDMFAVPDFTDFIYMNNTPYTANGCDVIETVNDVASHFHYVKPTLGGTLSGKIKFQQGEWCDSSNTGVHNIDSGGGGHSTNMTLNVSLAGLNADFGGKISSCAGNGKQTRPSFTQVPVMVYIGKKTR